MHPSSDLVEEEFKAGAYFPVGKGGNYSIVGLGFVQCDRGEERISNLSCGIGVSLWYL
jgi:hypothetical protein